MTVAEIIIDQLGGNRFIAMTGANRFYAFHDGVSFSLPARCAKNRIRHCMITLRPDDTYDVEFGTAIGLKYRVKARHEGIYCDQLQEIFTTETGLSTNL